MPEEAAADRIVVLDVGKTHARLLLATREGEVIAAESRPAAAAVIGGRPSLDVAGIGAWVLERLAQLPERHRIGRLVPVAHGAAAVLLDGHGTVLAAPDYEDPALAAEAGYEALRDPFEQSFSPSLPGGLNLGRQLHALSVREGALFRRVRYALPYAQYWAWFLSGVMASERTSLGCHTDLWRPREDRFSDLAQGQGWDRLFPPLRGAGEVLGPLQSSVAAQCGLPAGAQVLCGLHDSNASFFRHRAGRTDGTPFTVVSSGTWTVLLSAGASLSRLREEAGMLANVDALGQPVATARFMGGREYAVIAGPDGAAPDLDGLRQVLASGAAALPAFAEGGPFGNRAGEVLGTETLDARGRAALATLYLALVTDHLLDLLGHRGTVILEGPLARNPLYGPLLATLRPGEAVSCSDAPSGSLDGAALLAGGGRPPVLRALPPPEAGLIAAVAAHRAAWRRHLPAAALTEFAAG